MKNLKYVVVCLLFLFSCSDDEDNTPTSLRDIDALIAIDSANPTNTLGWDTNDPNISNPVLA